MAAINRYRHLFILFFTFFLLVGCGTNNSETVVETTAPVIDESQNTDEVASLSVINGESVKVTKDAQSIIINVRALNKYASPVTSGQVGVQYPVSQTSSEVGTMMPAIANISNGIAEFVYTGPDNLQDLIDGGMDGTTFTFYDVNDTSVNTSVDLVYDTTVDTTVEPSGVETIILSYPTITISEPNQEVDVLVYAFDANGQGVDSATLNIVYDSSAQTTGIDVGTVPSSVEITDGQGAFTYIAPSNTTAAGSIDPSTFRIVDSTDSTVYATMRVSFVQANSPITDLKISTASSVLLTEDSQKVDVTVFALNNYDQPVAEGTIEVRYPTTDSKNGYFESSQVTVKDGNAFFTYYGPSTLLVDNVDWDRTFTFVNADNRYVTEDITFQFVPNVVTGPSAAVLGALNPITLTQNNEVVTITVRVFDSQNRPYEDGTVTVGFPDAVLTGEDVGSFSETSIEVESGKAVFVYTGPKDLNSLIADGVNSTEFTFTHSSSPANSQTLNVNYNPDATVIVNTSYYLAFTSSEGNRTMGLEQKKFFTLALLTEDDEVVDAADVTSITITSLAPAVGRLIEPDGTISTTATFNNDNSIQIGIQSYTTSGLVPLYVTVTFNDANGNAQTLEKTFDVVVFSGPPTSISIKYIGHPVSEPEGKFTDRFVVTVTDKYNNPVNTFPAISTGAMVGYANDPTGANVNPLDYAFHDPDTGKAGVTFDYAGALTQADPALFDSAGANAFDDVDVYNDYLVTWGGGYLYNATGKWDITNVVSSTQLELSEAYEGANTPNLGYAIGHNQRPLYCQPSAGEAVGTVYVDDGAVVIDENGTAKLSLVYDHYLTGKDVILWVNIVGYQADLDESVRIGEGVKVTLRGHGLEEESIGVAKNAVGVIIDFDIDQVDSPEKLYDANFGANTTVTGTVSCTLIDYNVVGQCLSNGGLVTHGVSFVRYSCDGGTDGGTVTIHPVVGSEFY